MADYIVCGWFTPDYQHWADSLAANLARLGEPHDLVRVEKAPGGWEANTMRKPAQILAAMERHPNRTIIFVDVDCEVRQPLGILATMAADVGVHFRCRFLRDDTPRLNTRSGTMVFRPTPEARALVDRWCELSQDAPKGAVDQRTLPMAIATTPGLTIEVLHVRYCAVAADQVADPVILHDSASKGAAKIASWRRAFHHIIGKRAPVPALAGGAA
jgi:hypothetical protein